MNKLIIICPPNVPYDLLVGNTDKNFVTKLRAEIPMGAISIITYIRQFYPDWEYHLMDLCVILDDIDLRKEFVNKPEDVLEQIFKRYKSSDEDEVFLGISSLFNATFTYLDVISRILRNIWPKGFIFTGGTCSSNLANEVFEAAPYIEAINYGEGELPILKYIQADNKTVFLNINKSWITRDKVSDKTFNPEHDFIENLDDIGTLDYSLIDFDAYSSHTHSQTNKKIISAPLMFSRGCPFNCCFCASHSAHGRKVRYNSLDRIMYDIKKMQELYSINTLVIWDDNFFVDMERAYALLDYCENLEINMEFANSFPVYRMDEKLITRLKASGVEVASLAIESGCQRVLNEVMHKGHVKLEMVHEAIKLLRKHDFYVKGLFVIGLPGETKSELEETVEFIKNAELNWVDVFAASPVAGSELYDICKSNGYLNNDDASVYDFYTGCISTDEFTSYEIEQIQLETVLYVDFVNNWDMKHGNYERALINFEHVIKSNPDNPLAFYYASQCADKINDNKKSNSYYNKAKDIIEKNAKWIDVLDKFDVIIS